jgi:ABC-type uncharacterized transport system substrate-binding protein
VTGDIDRVSLAKEIVEQQPDVILVESTAAVATLSRASSTIPIVFVNVAALAPRVATRPPRRPAA